MFDCLRYNFRLTKNDGTPLYKIPIDNKINRKETVVKKLDLISNKILVNVTELYVNMSISIYGQISFR